MGYHYIPKTDEDKRAYFRPVVSPEGWTYQAKFISFKLADPTSLKSLVGNADDGWSTYKMYKSDGTITTTPSECVRTSIEFRPLEDISIIAARVRILADTTENIVLDAIAARDVPAPNGFKVMTSNLEAKFMKAKEWTETNGRASKYMTYVEGADYTNKITIDIYHTHSSPVEEFEIGFDLYRA